MYSPDRPLRLAFAGFRHGHIMDLYMAASRHSCARIVGACEEHAETAARITAEGKVTLTHARFAEMLATSQCDAVAIGDYYAARGAIAIAALKAGKHVIADKPLCTRMSELEEIGTLASRGNLKVDCMLSLRARPAMLQMRELLRAGEIGQVQTLTIAAQHPLMLGSRPSWYFEPGKHGGTLNDLAVHAVDLIPWLTGLDIKEIVAARAWNARLPQYPHFQDAAQYMLRLENNAGVMGDVSYLAPDRCGYSTPQYWRFTCHGAGGMVEARSGSDALTLATSTDQAPRSIPVSADKGIDCLDAFLLELAGKSPAACMTTKDSMRASRIALLLQETADHHRAGVCV
jgi:predicted dehydrogenase